MPNVLQITERQYRAFVEQSLADANTAMVRYARERFPDKFDSLPDRDIIALVERVRRQAAEFEIEDEDDVATYFDLAVVLGEGFILDEWVLSTLTSTDLSAVEKIDLLLDDANQAGTAL